MSGAQSASLLSALLARLTRWSKRGGTQSEVRFDELCELLLQAEIPVRELIPVVKQLRELLPQLREPRRTKLVKLIGYLERNLA